MAAAPFGKWDTQTFVAGLRCHELVAPWIIEGAMDGRTFDAYVRTQLAPCLERGDVVILDNLNVYKSPRAAQALDQPAFTRNRFNAEKLIDSIKVEQLSASNWTRVALAKRGA